MEAELKLRVDPGQLAGIRKLAALREHAAGKPSEQARRDVYFDTKEFWLWKHGLALRVRGVGEHFVQTLKDAGSTLSGLKRRGELEQEISGPAPDFSLLRRQARKLAPGLAKKLSHAFELHEVFDNRVQRTTWALAWPDGARVECALDTGAIDHGADREPIGELELEMKEGDPARLYDLAREVHAACPVHIEMRSKAERGFALVLHKPPLAAKAVPVRLRDNMAYSAAVEAILSGCAQQIQANAAGVRVGDVESLHQMRVGLRRLRAALGMVRSVVEPTESVQAGLEWLAGALGDSRNWDVFLATVLPQAVQGELTPETYAAVRTAAEKQAQLHREQVIRALDEPRYTALMLELGSWIALRGWERAAPDGHWERKTGRAAARLVRQASTRTRKRLHDLDPAKPECVHRARIATKKERYVREFFEGLVPFGKRIASLTEAQVALGTLNDLRIARTLLGQLENPTGAAPLPLEWINGLLAGRYAALLPAAHKRLLKRLC